MNKQEQLKILRTLVQEMGWGEFMRDVGSLMAEQSEKVAEPTSTDLAGCSRTIHAMDEFFQKCGRFTYPKEWLL